MKLDREKFVHYATTKNLIKKLEGELAEMAEELKFALASTPEGKLELEGYGMFSLYGLSSWSYSPAVDDLKFQLKNTEAAERADGTAAVVEKQILKFISKKEEEI